MDTLTLRLCGSIEIRDADGRILDAVMRQPKRLMLLAHLALCSAEGFARRDTVAALFWPDSDAERARHALRQSIYFLRSHMGEDALMSQGNEELQIDLERVWCDVTSLETALTTGRLREAHSLYRGDLLEGLYAREVSEQLEQLMDARRTRLKERMAEAAWELAERGAAAGDALEVHHWGRRAMELSREIESAHRRLIQLLDWVGDAGAALAVHDDLVERLENDLGVAPSPETTRLVERLRNRPWTRPGGTAPGAPLYEVPLAARVPTDDPQSRPDNHQRGGLSTEGYGQILSAGFILLAIAVLVLTMLMP